MEHGGDANDEELLAELRAISNKSSSSRFVSESSGLDLEDNKNEEEVMKDNTVGSSGEVVEIPTNDEEERIEAVKQEDNTTIHNKTRSSSISVTMSDECCASTFTQADINKLNYRALQKKCKSVGVSAAGSTVALRERLYEHFGLSESEVRVFLYIQNMMHIIIIM